MAINRETLRLLDGMRIDMLAPVDAATQDLVRAWGVAWNELAADWDTALTDLAASSKGGAWPTRAQIRKAKRVQAALAATREALMDLSRDLPVRVTQALPTMTEQAADWSRRLTASQYPAQAGPTAQVAASFERVDPRALDAIVRRTTEQVTALSRPLSAQAEAAMRSTLIRGIALGDNPRDAARTMLSRVEGGFNGGRTRALVIARTEMISAHREAAWAQDQAATDVLAGWTWTCALDRRACPACLAMHGTVHPVADPGPLGHQQCRCSRTPKAKSWRDLGFDIDEPADIFPDARSWFEDLPEGSQLDIMGKARLDLLKSGSVTWDDLATRRTSAGWRDSFAPTSVKDLAAKAAA